MTSPIYAEYRLVVQEKPFRIPALNGILRLVWTYLYRCHESASTATTKMQSLMKHFFPANRLTVFPQEDRIELLAYIVHFILSRHFDYGSELTDLEDDESDDPDNHDLSPSSTSRSGTKPSVLVTVQHAFCTLSCSSSPSDPCLVAFSVAPVDAGAASVLFLAQDL